MLALDVRQFFPSIDHAILQGILARTLVDAHVLDLASKIIASGAGVQRGEYDIRYYGYILWLLNHTDWPSLQASNAPRVP